MPTEKPMTGEETLDLAAIQERAERLIMQHRAEKQPLSFPDECPKCSAGIMGAYIRHPCAPVLVANDALAMIAKLESAGK